MTVAERDAICARCLRNLRRDRPDSFPSLFSPAIPLSWLLCSTGA